MSLGNEYTPLPTDSLHKPRSYGATRPTLDTDVERLLRSGPGDGGRDSDHERDSDSAGSGDDLDDLSADELAIRASIGVKTAEATQRVYGPLSKRFLFIGIALAAYIYSLDAVTTASFPTFAASEFNAHNLIGAISVTQGVIIAVGKPVIAKFTDASSRGTAYLFIVIFYVLGYLTTSLSPSIPVFVIGAIFATIASSALQLLTQILIADHTTLRARGLVNALSQIPFVINAPLGSFISSRIINNTPGSWRLGYALFMVVIPICLSPVVTVLLWSERRAKRLGLVARPGDGLPEDCHTPIHSRRRAASSPITPVHSRQTSRRGRSRRGSRMSGTHHPSGEHTRWERAARFATAMDLVGLLLLVCGVTLLLVPLTLNSASTPAANQDTSSSEPEQEATWALYVGHAARSRHAILFGLGMIFLALFAFWEKNYAESPVIAPAFVKNKAVIITALIGFCDFASFYLTYTYLLSFILVVKDWELIATNNFMQLQGMMMTLCGIGAGIVMAQRQQYKHVLVGGLSIRLAGVLLMLYTRRGTTSALALVLTQILQGMGGGIAAISLQVGAQASVSHSDLAIVTAVVLLFMEIGGAVGGALAGGIWSNTLPSNLAKYLPDASDTLRKELFGSIDAILRYSRDDPIREGVVNAYSDTMWTMIIAATIFAVVPFYFSFRLPDVSLTEQQSVVADDLSRHRRSRSRVSGISGCSVSRGHLRAASSIVSLPTNAA